MKIYIDFDDVICETGRYFLFIAEKLFDIVLPYSEFRFFNLQQTFKLSDKQYKEIFDEGHKPQSLLAFEETPHASEIINKWLDEGHEVYIVTGRPYETYDISRQWLNEHGLDRIEMYCVDKYGSKPFLNDSSYSMTLSELYEMDFDFAIDDSPASFEHILHFKNCKTVVFERPWNINAELPNDNFIRCSDWLQIDELLERICAKQNA